MGPSAALLDELAEELGAPPPAEFEQLSDDDVRRLTALLAGAREHQSRALVEAIDQGLEFIPRLARGAVKRALFA